MVGREGIKCPINKIIEELFSVQPGSRVFSLSSMYGWAVEIEKEGNPFDYMLGFLFLYI